MSQFIITTNIIFIICLKPHFITTAEEGKFEEVEEEKKLIHLTI